MKKLILLSLLLAGCATCRNHPAACGIVVGLTAGEIIYLTNHHEDHPIHPHRSVQPVTCQGEDCQ